MVHAAASAVGAWLDKPKVFERGDDAVVVDAVGDIVGLFLEEVRCVAHGDTDIGSTKKLQVNMANIRKKLGSRPGSNAYILNELGVGYRMIDEDNDTRNRENLE